MAFNYEIKNGTIVTPKRGRTNTSDTISAWSTPDDYDSNDSNHSSSEDQESAPSTELEDRETPSRDGTLESYAIHPDRRKMKKQRARRTAGGALGGCIVGGLVLGPLGIIVGAPVGAYTTNKICKKAERRAQRKFEHKNFEKIASTSLVHSGELV
jgi:hypothetical protein